MAWVRPANALKAVLRRQQKPKIKLLAVLAVAAELAVRPEVQKAAVLKAEALKAAVLRPVVVPAVVRVPKARSRVPVALAVSVNFRKKALTNVQPGLAKNSTSQLVDSMKS